MKNRFLRLRIHFHKHRFAYGVATGMSVTGFFVVKRAEEWNAFLKEHNLFDEFYELEA